MASPTFRKNAQGKPLPEHNYGENCAIYDPSKPEGHRFDNIKACLISHSHCLKSAHNSPQVGIQGAISPLPAQNGVFDIFVVAHFFGWWSKMFMLRDFAVSMSLSALFEVVEMSLQHWFPNFRECWWDRVSSP